MIKLEKRYIPEKNFCDSRYRVKLLIVKDFDWFDESGANKYFMKLKRILDKVDI